MVGREVFNFFERFLFGDGCFSELNHFMRFLVSHKQEIIDEDRKDFLAFTKCRSHIISAMRSNNKLRMAFNEGVMGSQFSKHWLNTLNDMFVKKPDSVGQITSLENRVNLKFGEELEYNLISEVEESSRPGGGYVRIFEDHMKKIRS